MFFFRPVFLRLIVFYNFNFTRTFFWVFCYLRGWFTVLLFTCSCTWLFTTFINSVQVIFIWYFLCCRRLFSIHISSSSSLELSDYSWSSSPLISLSKLMVFGQSIISYPDCLHVFTCPVIRALVKEVYSM